MEDGIALPKEKRKNIEKVYGCSKRGHEDGWCNKREDKG